VPAPRAKARSSRRAKAEHQSDLLERFAAGYPFPLDAFQVKAIRALENGRSVLAAAPTGTGKTVLAEFGLFLAREQGLKAIYTAPIKALSNQKFRDWRQLYGDDVGLLTGDVSENPTGSIMVMTTEVLRNMLLETPHSLDSVGCVIFDEVHFLADPERGTIWEESILYCPKHVQLVCLSATVPNAGEIATWISLVHRETSLVTHATRAVPIEHLYYLDGELHKLIDARGEVSAPLKVGGENRVSGGSRQRARDVPRPREVVQTLDELQMLPAIYFIFGRRACELAANDCIGLDLVSTRDGRGARRETIQAYLQLLAPEDRMLEQVQSLVRLLQRGIAFHHAGLLPLLKSLVEELFAAGHVGAVFATETLALGINMPARSVVIAEQTKFDGESRRLLLPNEYSQLTGRAGRRGLDPKGYAVNLYSPWVSCAEAMEVMTADLLPIRSAFTPRYNTVAALWDGSRVARDRLVRLFSSSLRQFQMNDELKESAGEVDELRDRAASAHYECPYDGVPDEAIQQYIGLRREVSDARKRAQRAGGDAAVVRRRLLRPPWPVPSTDTVRREFQRFSGGEVVYVSGVRNAGESADGGAELTLRPGGWGVFLRRRRGGPGLILLGNDVEDVSQWADVTRLPDGKPAIALPYELREIDAPVGDVRRLIGPRVWRSVQNALQRLDLPDLPGLEERQLGIAQHQLMGEMASAGERAGSLTRDVSEIEDAIAVHPCHRCPVRGDHERAMRAELNALRALGEAEHREKRLEEAAASQAERTLDALTGTLQRFAFLQAPPGREREDLTLVPTEKSKALSRVYDVNGLLLLVLSWEGVFERILAAEMMELLSWFCFDRDAPRWNRHTLSQRLWDVRLTLSEWIERVQAAEAQAGITITVGPNSAFYGPVLAWCRGATFAHLLDQMPISEGDLLLALNKTLDLAAQLREALRSHAPTNLNARGLVAKLEVGDRLLRRGIVAQSLKLATALPG